MRSFSLEVALQGCLPVRRVSDPGNDSSFLTCLPGWPALGRPVGLKAGRKGRATLAGCLRGRRRCWVAAHWMIGVGGEALSRGRLSGPPGCNDPALHAPSSAHQNEGACKAGSRGHNTLGPGSLKPSIGILSKGMPLEGDRGGEPLKCICPLVGVVGSRDLLVAIVIMGLAAPWVRGGGHGEGSLRGRPWCLSRS